MYVLSICYVGEFVGGSVRCPDLESVLISEARCPDLQCPD